MLQGIAIYTGVYDYHKLDLLRYFQKIERVHKSWDRWRWGWVLEKLVGRLGDNEDQNTLYEILKE